MIDVTLLSASSSSGEQDVELSRERRPAILTYYSPVLEYVHRAIKLPWFVVGWRKEEEKLVVPIFEELAFARGWKNLPSGARLELSNAGHLQVYNAEISFRARLRGLRYEVFEAEIAQLTISRYLMYNWKLTSFIFFTSTFWAFELTFMSTCWILISLLISNPDKTAIKQEFPEKAIKQEPETAEESGTLIKEEAFDDLNDYPPATEADIEDEEELELPVIVGSHRGFASDSGLGTSMDSSSTRPSKNSVRRRPSRPDLDD
jgi:seipin